jgi:flagellar M-ring protein FliF
MTFDVPTEGELVQQTPFMRSFLDKYLWSLIQSILLAVVAIVLGMFVLRPMLRPQAGPKLLENSALQPMTLDGDRPAIQLEAVPQASSLEDGNTVPAGNLEAPTAVKSLQHLAETQTDDVADMISDWLSDDPKTAA